jgi:hypothetical protein
MGSFWKCVMSTTPCRDNIYHLQETVVNALIFGNLETAAP